MSDPESSEYDPPVRRYTGISGGARRRWGAATDKVQKSLEKKNTYAYKNIDYDKEIRVLKIFPGKPGTEIVCRLVPYCPSGHNGPQDSSLSDIKGYAALSYYWGKDNPEHRVYMFDSDETYNDWTEKDFQLSLFVSYFRVRHNLKAALEQLRQKRRPAYLWVDALCINQKNVLERTAQVARMHEIYTQAEKVYIWLGEGIREENEKTFNFLNDILDLAKLEQLISRLAKKDKSPTWLEDRQNCKRTVDLMKADWFSRRWIIQELALATNAHVRRGHCEMPWTEFADAIALFMTKNNYIRHAFGEPKDFSASRNSDDQHIRALDPKALGANTLVTATGNLFRKSNDGKIQQRLLSLEVLVSSMLLAFEATDPKDTIFAVLQIAKDTVTEDTAIEKIHSDIPTADIPAETIHSDIPIAETPVDTIHPDNPVPDSSAENMHSVTLTADPLAKKTHLITSVTGTFNRLLLFIVNLWIVNAVNPLSSEINSGSTVDLSASRNTALSATSANLFIFINCCIALLITLLSSLNYTEMFYWAFPYMMNLDPENVSGLTKALDKKIDNGPEATKTLEKETENSSEATKDLDKQIESIFQATKALDKKTQSSSQATKAFDRQIESNSQATKALDKRIEANYQKCLRDVCADFIEYCIETSNSLDVICRHWAPKPKPSLNGQMIDMPSWILPIDGHAFGGPKQLHFRKRVNGDSFVGGSERRSQYTASGNLSPSVKFGETTAAPETIVKNVRQEPGEYTKLPPLDEQELPPRFDGTLEVKGFQLDVIEDFASIAGHVISSEALKLCGWSKETGTTDIDQVWRVLVANRGPDGINPPDWYRRACRASLDWYNHQPEDTFNTKDLRDLKDTPSGIVEFLDRVHRVVYNRKLIRTRGDTGRKFIGLTPEKSFPSDIICILYGCSVPVVLRPLTGTGEFKFIGECYVHGVMDGEAVDSVSNRTREQWFKLR